MFNGNINGAIVLHLSTSQNDKCNVTTFQLSMQHSDKDLSSTDHTGNHIVYEFIFAVLSVSRK